MNPLKLVSLFFEPVIDWSGVSCTFSSKNILSMQLTSSGPFTFGLKGGFDLPALRSTQLMSLKNGCCRISSASTFALPSLFVGSLVSNYCRICLASGEKYSFMGTCFSTISRSIYFLQNGKRKRRGWGEVPRLF